MSWRFYLRSVPDGVWIDKDLPLVGGEVSPVLSGPASIRGTVPVELGYLRDSRGDLVIREGGCELIAEDVGRRTYSGIVDKVTVEGESLVLEAGGFSMITNGVPWLGKAFNGIKVDPLDMVRKIFGHVGSYPDVAVDVAVDSTTSKVRIGEEERQVSFTTSTGEKVEFETGPYRLNWWSTDDLSKEVADLAEQTPFQYRELTTWVDDEPRHRLELGHPRVGGNKDDLRFEVGLNVIATPTVDQTEYASEVIVYGAGEGRKKVSSGPISVGGGRSRKVHIHTDTSIRTKDAAISMARKIAKQMRGGQTIESLEVVDHDMARFGSFWEGDHIRVVGDAGWADLDLWVLIEDMSFNTDTGGLNMKVSPV